MEELVARSFWESRRVLVTGHTGFKGAWLTVLLHRLQATVFGYSLPPPTEPSLYEAGSRHLLNDQVLGDVRDLDLLVDAISRFKPEIVFHLAAQPLVRASYEDPLETITTNVLGTANLLEAVRRTPSVRAVIVSTTDKCYENIGCAQGYRETDPLGGRDPYSASKAAAEIITRSYRDSFFAHVHAAHVATVRAGNVLGGGDWAKDRLVPDAVRALESKRPLVLRYPQARRPWQHVLEPLVGSLQLAEALLGKEGSAFAGAWNFGPSEEGHGSVLDVVEILNEVWNGELLILNEAIEQPHEEQVLHLNCEKAQHILNWHSRWNLNRTISETAEWYKRYRSDPSSALATCEEQIDRYLTAV